MERSIISSLAFQYASKETIEDVEDLMTDFIEKYLEYKTMIVYLYDPEMDVADQSVGVSTEGLDKVKNSDDFKRRYDEFYSQILPNKYGITPLKLNVLDENNQSRRSEKNVVSDIVTAYKEDRLGQINVVCTQGGRKECLVLKRNEKKGGFWQTITGGIETRELLPEAARREVEEEIGVSTDKIEDIRPSDYTFSYIGGERYELHERVYAFEIDSDARVRISDEHVDAKWCNKEEAVDTVKYEGNKKAIESVFKS
jgi:8-oxo-dGTP pyrophosphatase MutT (NUDIX family)